MNERQEEILDLLHENQHGLTASDVAEKLSIDRSNAVSYTHLRAHETDSYLVCRLLLEKKKRT